MSETGLHDLPGFGMVELSLATVDPADALRSLTTDEPRNTRPIPQPAPQIDSTAFVRRVRVERARLAIVDPIGEWDAVVRLDHDQARRILEDARRPPIAQRPERRVHRDDRDLITALGGDPERSRGRVPCPVHGSRDKNLAWRLTPDGRALLTCFSHQCDFASIVAAAGR
jgi:hypothetical protein